MKVNSALMKRARSVDYITGSLADCEPTVYCWYQTSPPGQILYYSFYDEEFKDWHQIEELQMNIRSAKYASNVIISLKELLHNPEDELMPQWDLNANPEVLNYWYLVAIKI